MEPTEERFGSNADCVVTRPTRKMKLWFALRDRRLNGIKFVRQQAIGPYVVDFVCRAEWLVIEVDGGQHSESAHDRGRDATLASEGYRVMRFWNTDVLKNIDGVLQAILFRVT